ncbi:MAG: globin [Acidimicrobiales bacterium]|nr:globin [Acidimicrobiales bacterium]
MSEPEGLTLFELVGGRQWFVDLVDRFYDSVAEDPVLQPMYPDDLTDSRAHMTGFLVQYWGGPATYSEERGHPRLRMRHAPFAIGPAERDAWLGHMVAAVDAADLPAEAAAAVRDYFVNAAAHMINQPS